METNNSFKIYKELLAKGISSEHKAIIERELQSCKDKHRIFDEGEIKTNLPRLEEKIYDLTNFSLDPTMAIKTLEDLLERDKQRVADGFAKKIRLGKLIKPSRTGKQKIVVVPTTEEEKFLHSPFLQNKDGNEGQATGGSGDGKEGEVIGQQPVHPEDGEGDGNQPGGEGNDTEHGIESDAYEIGKTLTEKLSLPNIKEKAKKTVIKKYTYDFTDTNKKVGQVLDKKATIKEIIKTNLGLGKITDPNKINPQDFLVAPKDLVYKVLSKEKEFASQALVFFVRDYSGSMSGKPTEAILTQHVLIYSWLSYQYDNQVVTRFLLHDTEAKEVPDFVTYYKLSIAGGTKCASAYKLINEIVKTENLEKDYNIYVFHGTDGEDWEENGKTAIEELKIMLTYVNRIGVTIAKNSFASNNDTVVERYLKKSGLLSEHPDLIRLFSVKSDSATEDELIKGIKELIS